MKALLGGKGANLAEMARIGLPVPPGFTLTTELCAFYEEHGGAFPEGFEEMLREGIGRMEALTGRVFGDAAALPLLVSVRSGARESMPGMMDTILNLGLNGETVQALSAATENPRFAWDCYRRFVQMYGDVVMGVQRTEDAEPFEALIDALKQERYGRRVSDAALSAEDNQELVRRFRELILRRTGQEFPSDVWAQLRGAVGAVFRSWNNERAVAYRQKYKIPADWGTAVNVQSMVFGNTSNRSGSGVAFTRNPAVGTNEFYGEFLMNAQGEDVVAGVRTPEPVSALAEQLPQAWERLCSMRRILEAHFRDMQDFEFTIQEGEVYLLQTRSAKRTGLAAFRIACDMEREGLIDWKTALLRIPAEQVDQVLAPLFDAEALRCAAPLAKGLNAGPGAASGRIYLNAVRCIEAAARGEKALLVRLETSPEDLRGMMAAEGILTARGGLSSHAALVARQMGKVCVCGVEDMEVDYDARTLRLGDRVFREGDCLSLDGTAGLVYAGELPTVPSDIIRAFVSRSLPPESSRSCRDFRQVMQWCARAARMKVRANADTPEQAQAATALGAAGIGLCRTEHMFFSGDRIDYMRRMILSERAAERQEALRSLLPFQKEDFKGLFRAAGGRPVTIRLLDPPLHEFLPHTKEQQLDLAKKFNIPVERVMRRVMELHEFNPMLGHRGCRLGITFPEITEMQTRAILEAALETAQDEGLDVQPEIMVPLVAFRRELDLQKEVIDRTAQQVFSEKGCRLAYKVGTMMEIPRACLTADELAQEAEFFSFGTNDLTQTGLGMSRDDSASFMGVYRQLEIVGDNVFASLDREGVGRLMQTAIALGRRVRPDMEMGVCGEQGGDPASVRFCDSLGLNYVSCSPYRVPTALVAAAQSRLAAESPAPHA